MRTEKLISNLNLNGIEVIEKEIKELTSINGQLTQIIFKDSSFVEREGGFLSDTKSFESVDFARKLNIPTAEGHFGQPTYEVNDEMETCLKGLYIIGDSRTGFSGIASAVAEGSNVAAAITHQIIEERWRLPTSA